MRLTPILERIAPCGFAQTGGILEYAALKLAPGRLPAAYAIPTSDLGGDNRNDGGIDQRVAHEFAVVLVLNLAQRNAAGIDEELEERSARVKAALVGWKHPDASAPTLYGGGSLLSADGVTLAWALRFRTAYHLRTKRS